MVIVKEPKWIGGHEIDVCLTCHLLWIDGDEHDEVPHPEDLLTKDGDTTHVSQAIKAAAEISLKQEIKELEDKDIIGKGPEGPRSYLGILGLPVKYDDHYYDQRPWVSWLLAFSMFMIHLVFFENTQEFYSSTGLISTQVVSNPMSLFTWSFVHGGWIHLISNLYFIGLVSDDVEHYIGRTRFIICMVLFPILIGAITAILKVGSDTPVIGASGTVTALLVMYALIFRKSRIAFLMFYNHITTSKLGAHLLRSVGWFRISVIWVILFYLLKDFLYFNIKESYGTGGVAHSAHLAGGLVGFLAWLFFGMPNWYKDQEENKPIGGKKVLIGDTPLLRDKK
jgi:membrane associated rhomboid family serine protease